MGIPVVWEEQTGASGKRPQSSENINRLRRQRDEMIAAHLFFSVEITLHAGSRNAP
jgi:hypothetical protein